MYCMAKRWWHALAALALSAQALPPGPATIYGEMFAAVQEAKAFPDGKTFVDAVPRDRPEAILAAWRREKPQGREAIRAFVLRNFEVPGESAPAPATLTGHIAALWPQLTRPALTPPPGSTALALPAPYVVPGGRFREIYYWDSYFTTLGLKADGRQQAIEDMLTDFASLIDRYGFVPNGTRTYYLGRSQPPFLSFMMDLSDDPAKAPAQLATLRAEHRFWMAGPRVVRMPDGSTLNRYWDDRPGPRDESWAEDVATARAAGRPVETVYRDLRAGAESGWDYSSRWLADPMKLETIRTTQIVPVDLNALLWALERNIVRRCKAAGDACAAEYEGLAAKRAAAMRRYLWMAREGRFADWDSVAKAPTPVVSAATLYPLFVGMATPAEARRVATLTQARLLAQGGLRTTMVRTGQQWDAPNGWAPLQWIAVDGLARYGHVELAKTIASRWIATVNAAYRDTGKLLEKYDVEERRAGGGGEYPLQDGFGWTNGVTRALIARYPALDPDKK